jgi:hypothetical protein
MLARLSMQFSRGRLASGNVVYPFPEVAQPMAFFSDIDKFSFNLAALPVLSNWL